jgi:hypothetical protein
LSTKGSQQIRGQVCPGLFYYHGLITLSLERGVIIIKLRKSGFQKYFGYSNKLAEIILQKLLPFLRGCRRRCEKWKRE